MALPTFTKTIDDWFVTTWYELRADAIDNILSANVVWAAFVDAGCLTPQTGGKLIERTIRYGTSGTPKAVDKTDTFTQGEPELKTAAFWNFRNLSAHVQRNLFDDRENSGKFRIQSYLSDRLTAAKEALEAQYETDLLRVSDTTETAHKYIQSLNDIIPTNADKATGTYGGITRSTNTWWRGNYKAWTLPREVNMITDMTNLYNTCYAHQNPIKLIVTTQAMFELYLEYGIDASQIVKKTNDRLVDMGFEVAMFNGKPFVWSGNVANEDMYMLNTDFIELVYDPSLWFDMTEFKPIPLQSTRIAHIVSACNLITTQPRRHGRLYTA